MNPHARYRSSSTSGWTRIDMLLAIYDAAMSTLDRGLQISTESGQGVVPLETLVEIQKALLLLVDGLDDSAGEPVPSIRNLLRFIADRLQTRTPEGWQEARRLIETLRDAFRQIAEDCRQMELSGDIPSLQQAESARFRGLTA